MSQRRKNAGKGLEQQLSHFTGSMPVGPGRLESGG